MDDVSCKTGTLLPWCAWLCSNARIVLGSSSPRRCEILGVLFGVDNFDIAQSDYEETVAERRFEPNAYVTDVCLGKYRDIRGRLGLGQEDEDGKYADNAGSIAAPKKYLLLIAADTVIVAPERPEDYSISESVADSDGRPKKNPRLLEKPRSTQQAAHMLTRLSGLAHEVKTCVAYGLFDQTDGRRPALFQRRFVATTRVQFRKLSPADIAAYVASGDGDGKAGGYGIQGLGSTLVSGVDGDYLSVVGFPLSAFSTRLASDVARLRLRRGKGEGDGPGVPEPVGQAGAPSVSFALSEFEVSEIEVDEYNELTEA